MNQRNRSESKLTDNKKSQSSREPSHRSMTKEAKLGHETLQTKITRDMDDLQKVENNIQVMNDFFASKEPRMKVSGASLSENISVEDCLRVKEAARERAREKLNAIKQKENKESQRNEGENIDDEREYKYSDSEMSIRILKQSYPIIDDEALSLDNKIIPASNGNQKKADDWSFVTRVDISKDIAISDENNLYQNDNINITEIQDNFNNNNQGKINVSESQIIKDDNNDNTKTNKTNIMSSKSNDQLKKSNPTQITINKRRLSTEISNIGSRRMMSEAAEENTSNNNENTSDNNNNGGKVWSELTLEERQEIWMKRREMKRQQWKKGKEEEAIKEVSIIIIIIIIIILSIIMIMIMIIIVINISHFIHYDHHHDLLCLNEPGHFYYCY